MSQASLTALVTVLAIGCLAPVPTSGKNQAQGDADGAGTWTPPRGRPRRGHGVGRELVGF